MDGEYKALSSRGTFAYAVKVVGSRVVFCQCMGWHYRSWCRHAQDVLDVIDLLARVEIPERPETGAVGAVGAV